MLDFHKATREFPISREAKAKLQIALSKMSKSQVKKTIRNLREMEYDCLEGKAKIEWEKIGKRVDQYGKGKEKEALDHIVNPMSEHLKDRFRMAAWCKFTKGFAQKYLESLEEQKKI